MADFTIAQGDTAPALEATLKDGDGNPVDLSGATIKFHMMTKRYNKSLVNKDATISDAANGKVQYSWAEGDTDTVGDHHIEWEVTHSNGDVESFPSAAPQEILIRRAHK